MIKKNKVLVLGADGFIGSNLVENLVVNGFDVRAFDLFRNGKSLNLEHLKDKIEFFQGDFLNISDINRALIDVREVIHLVSLTTPASSMNDPIIDIETNIKGSVSLFIQCVESGVKRVIYASSGGAIYGNNNNSTNSENDNTNPSSPYGIAKLTIEKYLEYFKMKSGLNYVAFRFSNPYGPRQNIIGIQGIIPIFLNLIRNGNPLNVYGDGENIRDYIYIDDMVNVIVQTIKNEKITGIYNVGNGKGISINELILIMSEVTNTVPIINYLPSRISDVRKVVLDTKKMKKEIGCFVKTDLRDGIKKTWQWINKNEKKDE